MYLLYERLKELRNRCNLSQNELAKKMGVQRATVNAWEMGISFPNAQSLVLLAKYFKVSVDYLLGYNDDDMIDVSELNDKEKKLIYDMITYMLSTKKDCEF